MELSGSEISFSGSFKIISSICFLVINHSGFFESVLLDCFVSRNLSILPKLSNLLAYSYCS